MPVPQRHRTETVRLFCLCRAFLWKTPGPKEVSLEQQRETLAPPSGLCFGGPSDPAEAEEEVKVQASGASRWQVPVCPMKGERDMVLIFVAALVELAAFGEL